MSTAIDYQKWLSQSEIKFIYGSLDRNHLVRLHWGWLEKQTNQDLKSYIAKLEWLHGWSPEFIFSKKPDMRTKKGLLEVISTYYNKLGV